MFENQSVDLFVKYNVLYIVGQFNNAVLSMFNSLADHSRDVTTIMNHEATICNVIDSSNVFDFTNDLFYCFSHFILNCT